MTSANPHAAAASVGLAAGRQPFPVELDAEFSELQAAAPSPSFVPAVLVTTLLFHVLLVAEHALLHLSPPYFALRGLGVTAASMALILLPVKARRRDGARVLAVLLFASMMAALLGAVPFEGAPDLLAVQSGAAALILTSGFLLRLPFAWSVLLAAAATLTNAIALFDVPQVELAVRVESLWAPAMAAAFSILSAWVRLQEARREFLSTRKAAFAEVQAAASPDAHHLDEVTGIANRTAFDMRLRAAWEHAVTRRNSVALLGFTIDDFSNQKKLHGQRFGDLLQTQVATTLKDGLRRSDDMVARFDAQKFVVMLPGVGLDGATQIAERLRGAVEEASVYVGTTRHRATVTVGVVSMRAKRGVHRDLLVENTFEALEQGCKSGKNLVFVGGRGCLPKMA